MSRMWITATACAALLALAPPAPASAQEAEPIGGRAVEVRVIEHDEFRWGDAAVGALAGVGLVVLCAGVMVAIGAGRGPHRR